jgi:hypothetical protein
MGALYGMEGLEKGKGYKKKMDIKQKRISGSIPGALPMSAKQAMMRNLKKESADAGAIGSAFMQGLGIAAAGAAVGGAGLGVASLYTKMQSGRMFKTLQARHPEIKRNPKAREYFDLIVAYAPSLMKHPNAIGDFLKRQLEYPMSSVEFIKQLADLENTVSGTTTNSPAWQMGQSAAGQAHHFMPRTPVPGAKGKK